MGGWSLVEADVRGGLIEELGIRGHIDPRGEFSEITSRMTVLFELPDDDDVLKSHRGQFRRQSGEFG
jgi:hypothetical protein